MNQEQKFSSSEILLSTTDLNSHIKYANKNFCKIAGYSLDEMQGNPHNMVRHPDMPKAAFKDLWSTIQSGKSWMGPVKNKCKNGDYYWVNAFVTPIKDSTGKVTEYQSVRTTLEEEVKNRATDLYSKLNSGQKPKQAVLEFDMTMWVQILMFLLVFTSVLSLIFSDQSLWLSLPSLLIAIGGASIFTHWRNKYRKVVDTSKQVFDKALMSYLYSGTNDDIGCIELALKMQKSQLNAVLGRVSDDSENITKLAQQSSVSGNEIAETLNLQAAETDQVATAINQMAMTVQEIAKIVGDASQSSQQGLEISTEGQKIVFKTVDEINNLSEQLTNVDNAITRLIDGSKAITTVLNEISSIADQTNLLALNAAIEAARAGEQGRGFAVVAEEVRALAMRSQQSTEEIGKLLAQLETESDSATNAMEQGNQLSKVCVGLASETGQSLESITSEVSQLVDISAQIAAAVEEQSVVSEEISKNTVSISDMATKGKDGGLNAASLTEELLNKLHEQHSLLSQFR